MMLPPSAPEQPQRAPQASSERLYVVNASPTESVEELPQPESPPTPLHAKTPSQEQPPPVLAPVQSPSPLRNGMPHDLPPTKPVFGVSLDDLYARDGTAVPLIVYQCFQAIELFGLEVEGIYRLSGSATHINRMKAFFDNGELNIGRYLDRNTCFSLTLLICRRVASGFHEPREFLPRY